MAPKTLPHATEALVKESREGLICSTRAQMLTSIVPKIVKVKRRFRDDSASSQSPNYASNPNTGTTCLTSTSLMKEQLAEGVSTFVYRITVGSETFYQRILPEEGKGFAPDVALHIHLRQKQVKVPDVIYFEQCHDLLQWSIMVTTEIKGQPLSQSSTLPKSE